jgi:hypothetical protein
MKTQNLINSGSGNSLLKIRLLALLLLLISTGFVWMATDQVIAPPLVRAGDLLYRLFICRCFFQFTVL